MLAPRSILKIQRRAIHWSKHLANSQVQEARKHVKEYTETPKPAKARVLKKFKDPFPKSLFIGKCDPEVLEYPEVLTLEEIDTINNAASTVRFVVGEELNSKEVDETGVISKDVLKRLADLKLWSTKLPLEYDGLGLTETDTLVINEAAGSDASIYKLIVEQQHLSGSLLQKFGTEDQKLRYLVPLISGESTIACAYQEKKSFADADLETVAVPDGEGGFEITGKKMWVYNAPSADTLIVFAQTVKTEEGTGLRSQTSTAFLVPVNTPGITIHEPISKLGARAVPACEVEMSGVKVDGKNVLGPVHMGNEMMTTLGSKFDIAPAVLAISKRLLDDVTKYVINTNFLAAPMQEMEAVQSRLGKIATAIYCLESAAYLKAGHSDLYENPDTFLESCILKVMAGDTLEYVLKECLQLLGPEGHVQKDFDYLDRILRDFVFYYVCDETKMNLNAAIALSGLQHAGLTMHEEVRKVRNPLMFPVFIMKKVLEGNKRYGGDVGNDLGLAGYLHPSLKQSASVLEYCVSRVQMSCEILLSRHGKQVLNAHSDLEALASIAIATYQLTATLGRASRSYCIGLAECDFEMEIALATAVNSRRKVNEIIQYIREGSVDNNTTKYKNIAQRVLANKGCFTQSPITRNF